MKYTAPATLIAGMLISPGRPYPQFPNKPLTQPPDSAHHNPMCKTDAIYLLAIPAIIVWPIVLPILALATLAYMAFAAAAD